MAAVEEAINAREYRLQLAIEHDNVDELHNLIAEEQELLDRVSMQPFPNTPLHFAAAAGKTNVAMEMAILKPSFARELNPEGYSPMHLALQHEQYHTVRALMTLDPTLIRVRGRGGITPLHFVARGRGDNEQENMELLELLAEFLCACNSSIEDLTSQCETAVHVAVKNHNLKAFKVLFGWLKRVHLTEILNWKDDNGQTVLHIASSEELQHEIIKLLTGNKIERLVKKMLRRIASAAGPPPSLSQLLSKEPTVFEKFTYWFGLRDESARNIILLLATLITTATYQAALAPPGGYWQDSSSNPPAHATVVTSNSSGIAVEKPHQAGNVIMSGSKLHQLTSSNSLAFTASIFTIWITAAPLFPRTLPVCLLMVILGSAFLSTATVEFPNSDEAAGNFITYFYVVLLSVALAIPINLWSMYKLFRCQIDATGRRVGKFQEMMDRK